jgi:hypothetical protein
MVVFFIYVKYILKISPVPTKYRNELDLDVPLYKYADVPKELKKDVRYKKITARMTLIHTSGLPNTEKYKILFEPGQKYSYSSMGYYFLQQIIEKITGLAINNFMKKEVFIPYNMKYSSYVYEKKYDHAYPHDVIGNPLPIKKYTKANVYYSLYTTANDYAKFLLALSNHKKICQQMLKIQVRVNDKISWGLGFGIEYIKKDKILWHWGDNGTFRNYVIFDPKNGGFVYFANSINGLSITNAITTLLYDHVLDSSNYLEYEQYDNPLRINRHNVYYTFVTYGVNSGLEEYKKWLKNMSQIDRDEQIEMLVESFNKEFIKHINAIKRYNDKLLLFIKSETLDEFFEDLLNLLKDIEFLRKEKYDVVLPSNKHFLNLFNTL